MEHTSLICAAINKSRLLGFTYDGHYRLVEPHLLGYYYGCDLVLIAWQRTDVGHGVGWREFDAHSIHFPALAAEHFAGSRPGYDPHDPTLEEVICRL